MKTKSSVRDDPRYQTEQEWVEDKRRKLRSEIAALELRISALNFELKELDSELKNRVK